MRNDFSSFRKSLHLPHCYYGLIRQSIFLLSPCLYTCVKGLCRLLLLSAGIWTFPSLSLQLFPQMLGPLPRWYSIVHVTVSSYGDKRTFTSQESQPCRLLRTRRAQLRQRAHDISHLSAVASTLHATVSVSRSILFALLNGSMSQAAFPLLGSVNT